MDDLLLSVNNKAKAIQLGREVSEILKDSKFELRKWSSNEREVLQCLASKEDAISEYFITNEDVTKTLGVIWQSREDSLQYQISDDSQVGNNKITKRSILSIISRIFDPLGLIGPITN